MVNRLPPFNHDAKCPKCGGDDINTRWKLLKQGHTYIQDHHGANEWLGRACQRCGYIWDEACLDGED